METLKDLIIKHNNDYGFDVASVIADGSLELPDLSIIIPYFETGEIFLPTLYHLNRAIQAIQKKNASWKYEIIVVDDGSIKKPADWYLGESGGIVRIVSAGLNQGRTKARNLGLISAQYEKCLFLDSDIFVSEESLLSHLHVHAFAKRVQRSVITVGFFRFSDKKELSEIPDKINSQNLELNDFRLDCIYRKTWIGCEADKQFIGKRFQIVKETEEFRRWPKEGFFGPWFLTNMVLGGFFVVDTKSSNKVGGFDEAFVGYGFTETSLPTKLVAGFGQCIVPVLQGGNLHIDDEEINVSRPEKDRIFREKHNFYFNRYLNLSWGEAVKGYGKVQTKYSVA